MSTYGAKRNFHETILTMVFQFLFYFSVLFYEKYWLQPTILSSWCVTGVVRFTVGKVLLLIGPFYNEGKNQIEMGRAFSFGSLALQLKDNGRSMGPSLKDRSKGSNVTVPPYSLVWAMEQEACRDPAWSVNSPPGSHPWVGWWGNMVNGICTILLDLWGERVCSHTYRTAIKEKGN